MGKVANLCGVVLVVVMAAAVAETAAQDTSCLTQLVPCLNFTSSKSTPPSSCCEPLKSLIRTNPQCLCSILQDDSLKKQSGVNATEAQGLPSRCGLNATAAACSGELPRRRRFLLAIFFR
ncbi:unnamed protein product [Spirodela intermedia]|uniref:Bifunctional inhibitor/plant lipid transfer protein/seed storage helical domain-containing protein n=2 Tax=Spirodela intermedia TaxID=51605 RepID=A0A7I8IGQ3_SPIIN|nr:unnamed protein product [Spirodela intermedia]CAA6656474.1 unnamed protein product [Spirodela intermedia]CAA7392052.1 unnamed protein product [Spirodela intermedia]